MKFSRTFFLVFFMAYVSALHAQPEITRGHLLVPGTEIFVQNATNPVGIGASGANAVWDFSAIEPEGGITRVNVGEADTTLYYQDFQTSNVVLMTSFGGFENYTYFRIDAQGAELMGNVISGFALTIYSDPETILQFPLTYNSAWEDDFSHTLEFFVSPINTETEGTSSVVVDGYGTLILPHMTFTDVLRMRTVTHTKDTTNLGLGISESVETVDTSYTWLSPSYHGPLCSASHTKLLRTVYLMDMDTLIIDSEEEEFRSFSFDPMSDPMSSVRDISPGKYDLRISPNPFIRSLDISFTAERSQAMRFTLQDMYGQVIYMQVLQVDQGTQTYGVDLPDLPAGMYIALLQSPDGGDVQKLIRIGDRR